MLLQAATGSCGICSLLERAWGEFQAKYSQYRPLTVKFDENFSTDMEDVAVGISDNRDDVLAGDLTEAHDRLQEIDPVLNKLLER